MSDLWTTLLPLTIASALVPIQIIATVLFLRSLRSAALAWVAGMTVTRLLQGVLFGLVVSSSDADVPGESTPGLVVSTLLLVLGSFFLVTALRVLVGGDDPDEAPPQWMARLDGADARRAFLLGALFMAVSVKFWAFTLNAVAMIGQADLGQPRATIAFVAFVVLGSSVSLALIAVAYVAPERSDALLDRISAWLTDHNRVITIVVGFVFGTWFVLTALEGFGII